VVIVSGGQLEVGHPEGRHGCEQLAKQRLHCRCIKVTHGRWSPSMGCWWFLLVDCGV